MVIHIWPYKSHLMTPVRFRYSSATLNVKHCTNFSKAFFQKPLDTSLKSKTEEFLRLFVSSVYLQCRAFLRTSRSPSWTQIYCFICCTTKTTFRRRSTQVSEFTGPMNVKYRQYFVNFKKFLKEFQIEN